MKHPQGFWRSGPALLLVLLSASLAFGQASSLSGMVFDPQGSAVVGATITVTNVATNAARVTVSSDEGTYQIPQLAPGTYRIRAEAKGFAVIVVEPVHLLVSTPVALHIRFPQVGAVNETVTVQGSQSIINMTD